MYTSTRLEWHQGDETVGQNPSDFCGGSCQATNEAFAAVSIVLLSLLPRAKIHQRDLRGFVFGGKWDRKPKFVANQVRLRTQPMQTGHRQTALKAAVTVLRGNGGTVPSQAQMSDLKRCAGTGRQDALRRVILQAVQSVRYSPMYVPDLSEIYMVLTNLVSTGLGEYLPIRTRLN